jgi:hypothetical protein
MGGTTENKTSTQTSQPWSVQEPYLTKGFAEAQKMYDKPGPAYYPESTVAGFSPNQTSAFGMGADLAHSGDANVNAASKQNLSIMNGNFGDSVFKNISDRVTPQVNAQFEGAGRYGSDSHAGALGTALTDAYAPFASSMMNQAMDRAPGFAQQQWTNINNLGDIGKQQQQMGQLETNDALARYNYNTQLPQLKLNQFMQNIGGNWGGTTTATQPVYQPSIWSQLLGAGLGAGGLLG